MHASTAKFRYDGTGGSLFGLVLVNSLLTMLTLGIYSFWAKNKVRQFHYDHTTLDGDPFVYHGTGGELLRGALRAFGFMLVLVIGYAGLTLATGGEAASPVTKVGVTLALYAVLFPLIAAAINLTRRYRLSRSSWRGIHFSFHGDTGDFVMLTLRGTLLTIVTLGFYTPFYQNEGRAFMVNNARFGSEEFFYDGEGRALFGDFVKAVLLTIPTLGLCWFWYAAAKHRMFWSHTRMRGGQFSSSVTGGDLCGLHLTNALLVLFTGGIAMAWAITRLHDFWCSNIRLAGTVDWASIHQHVRPANAMGEGLADTLDVDVGIGF